MLKNPAQMLCIFGVHSMLHCLLFRGLEQQASDWLDASTHTISYSHDVTRQDICRIVNAVWDDGMFITFALLPSVLAPASNIYRTDRCLETIRHVKSTPVLFLWMRASRLQLEHIPNAIYAVAFSIPSTTPFEVLDLSYVLIRFMDKYIRAGDYSRFNLVSLAYKCGSGETFGILLFDRGLRTVYKNAWIKSRTSNVHYSRRFNVPISTWPANCLELKRRNIVATLMANIRFFFFLLYPHWSALWARNLESGLVSKRP
ncbi:hypothetical protein B0H19DRAFT_191130 [Mycena capillaripes]|nr:hypothetical protein B0H19DRAFT_191130 [Mycena capillaripes]